MNTEIKKIALASAITLLAGMASADPLSWTEAGVGYNVADSVNEDATAIDIRGGIGFAGMGHAQLTYADGSVDVIGGSDIDFDGYEARAGVHPSVGDKTQLVVDAIYFDYSGDQGSYNVDEDGWGLGFGLRHQLGDQFEIRAQIDYVDGSWDDNDGDSGDFKNTTYSFGGRYYWVPNFFTGVGVTISGSEAFSVVDEGGDVIRVDAGWSFGGDVL
ncbi:MAG: hypothetical protein E4H19_06105 [Chromatiales bacterium]|nr:MAG: hypothetical protein E4H19_06105 [Chromatiales bacterium]